MMSMFSKSLQGLALCLALQAGVSAVNAEERVDDCRSIADNERRLECYDRLNTPPSPEPVPDLEKEAATAPVASPVPAEPKPDVVAMDDEVGSENLDRRKDDSADGPVIMGHVRNCKKNSNGRFFFFFDNGQVWKQKDNTRIPWRDCDFDVTITKDFFGYKMTPVGETRRVRISRVE